VASAYNHLMFKAIANLPPHTGDVHVSQSGKYIYSSAAVHAIRVQGMYRHAVRFALSTMVNCLQVAALLLLLLDAIYCSRGRARQKSSKSARTFTRAVTSRCL